MAAEQRRDPYFDAAMQAITESGDASIPRIQRSLGIGYNRSHNIIDQLAQAGLVSHPDSNGKRTILTVFSTPEAA